MPKNLKSLILVLTLLAIAFGVNAQNKAPKPCTLEVRCTKLDSVQHDLETMPFLKEEIESWKILNNQKDAQIQDQSNTILQLYAEIEDFKRQLESKDTDIGILQQSLKTANEKVKRRGIQRVYSFGLGYLAGKIF